MLKEKKNIFCLLGMIIGLAAIIVGIVVASHEYSGYSDYQYLSDAEFGADFYTYIYDAARYAGNNTKAIVSGVRSLHEVCATAFGWMFILGGLLTVCVFGSKLSLPKQETPVEVFAVPEEETPELVEEPAAPAEEPAAPAEE